MDVCLSPAEAPAVNHILAPAQQAVSQNLLRAIACGNVVVLQGDVGRGKTTVLRHVQAETGGLLLGMREFMRVLEARTPFAIEEAWTGLLEASLAEHDLVILDDMHLISRVLEDYSYPRSHLLNVAITAIFEQAAPDKKFLFAVEEDAPEPIGRRAQTFEIDEFTPADYQAICSVYLGKSAGSLDFARIHRFAPGLNAHQLRTACCCLRSINHLDTDRFVDYLVSRNLNSNVQIKEVAAVDWNELKGVDDVIRALDAKIAFPLEEHQVAAEFQLKPKRGVLLAGLPGTGKTTIGRALAHRLKSKFFLIDGSLIAGTNNFYCEIKKIFEAAKRNAPSIIFIDDADVLFEGDGKAGIYRYLLTMLDGLESVSAERICVMMTAMEVSNLPAALVRSGRIELWLETRLPDEAARQSILFERVAGLPSPLSSVDTAILAHASRGLTGADLKAAVEDAKLLYAHDRTRRHGTRPVQEYFLDAIAIIRTNRRNYARRKPVEMPGAVKPGFCCDDN
jgi:transitional endoplasmic reticulum ATPase